jgi:hypothetical protein
VALGRFQEFRYAVLDAVGQHLEVGVRREVAGDPEGDVAAVGEDRDPVRGVVAIGT